MIPSFLLNWQACGLFDVSFWPACCVLVTVHAVTFCPWSNCKCILHNCHSASNLEQEQKHTHTHTDTCTCTQAHKHAQTLNTHIHWHAHVHSWHAHHARTHTHTCKTYIDALVIVVCCFVLVSIELAMGMM